MSPNNTFPRVLIVSANASARTAKACILKEAGFAVHEASSGDKLMTEIHSLRPDLIILDSTLAFSGKLCRQLKLNPGTQNIMILQLSASISESLDNIRNFDLDADNYLLEPLAPVELITNSKILLRLSKNERALREHEQWKKNFLATFSTLIHDFRNILAPILNSIDLLFKLDPVVPHKLNKARNTIKFHAKSLVKIADELLQTALRARRENLEEQENHGATTNKANPADANVTKNNTSQSSLPINIANKSLQPPEPVATNNNIGKRVLVVDDYADVADTLAQWLRLAGHDVRTAYTGAQAIESTVAFHPDVVLLDIGLPDSSGFDIAKKLRALPNLQKFLLVAVTGYGQASLRKSVLEAGFDEHFAKPMDVEKLESIGLHV